MLLQLDWGIIPLQKSTAAVGLSIAVCWHLCVLVVRVFLDPLLHVPGVVPVKVFLHALFVFAQGCFDAFMQGLVCFFISLLVS